MSSFTEPIEKLMLSPLGDGKTFIIRTEFSFYCSDNPDEIITVPIGFITDGASVPRIFQSVIPRWGTYGKAAILHDFLYRDKAFARCRCDAIMKDAMNTLQVSKWQKFIIYTSIRVFGWGSWYRLKSTQGWKKMHQDKFRQLL
jgi:hypothetical protein